MGGGQKFLYEHSPDIFPQGFLTETEIALWAMHYSKQMESKENNG